MWDRYSWRKSIARVVRLDLPGCSRPRWAYLALRPEVRASVAFRRKSSGVGSAALARGRDISSKV